MNDQLRARLLKVLALAQQGVGGERDNAEVVLGKLLRQHNMTRADLEGTSEKRDAVGLKWRTLDEKMLACRLVIQIAGNVGMNDYPKNKTTVFWLTRSEEVAARLAWPVYQAAWQAAQRDVMSAFIHRHDLYTPDELEADGPEQTAEQLARVRRVAQMATGIERVERPAPRLTDGAA